MSKVTLNKEERGAVVWTPVYIFLSLLYATLLSKAFDNLYIAQSDGTYDTDQVVLTCRIVAIVLPMCVAIVASIYLIVTLLSIADRWIKSADDDTKDSGDDDEQKTFESISTKEVENEAVTDQTGFYVEPDTTSANLATPKDSDVEG